MIAFWGKREFEWDVLKNKRRDYRLQIYSILSVRVLFACILEIRLNFRTRIPIIPVIPREFTRILPRWSYRRGRLYFTYTLNNFEFRSRPTVVSRKRNLGNFVRSKLKKTSLRRFIYDIFPTHIYIYIYIISSRTKKFRFTRNLEKRVWPLASGSQLPVEFFHLAQRISISFKASYFSCF